MWFVLPILVLAAIAIVAGTSVERRLTAARETVREAELREAAVLRELATAKRAAAQAEADLQFLSRFVRELPHVAHEMHARAGGRHVASLLLSTVVRLLEPKKALVAVARRSPGGDGGARALAVVAVSPEGCMPLGIPVNVGKGEIGFAVEVQRVMDRKDFDAQPAATRRRLREQTGTDCQPDLVAPLVFNDEAVGVVAVEGPKRSSLEIKDALRLIAHIGAAALYTGARYSEINKTANTDGLTGIFNKRFVTHWLAEEIQRALAQTKTVSVFLFDVDNFKHYNDHNGHVAGDRLLRALAKLALQHKRGDTIFGRFGGEEFLMIFPGATRAQALAAAENLRETIARHDFPAASGQPLGCISVSGGVAECPVDATDSAALIRLADEALYAAKSAGRNRVFAFEPRYLGGEHAQEPEPDGEPERAAQRVALSGSSPLKAARPDPAATDRETRRRKYEAAFAEARRLLAESDASGALEAARYARHLEPERPGIVQFIGAIEHLVHPNDSHEDLIVVDEDELAGDGPPGPQALRS
jgi:diguanylate cyclase (GGDEF)-like protein